MKFNYSFLINDVLLDEYQKIKDCMGNYTSCLAEEGSIQISVKYNPSRAAIGIFLNRKGKEELILEPGNLNDLERRIVTQIHNTLSRKIDELRLPKEIWITESK